MAGYGAAAGAVLSMIGGIIAAPDKVVVPEFQKVDQEHEQQKAIAGNLASFDEAAKLSRKTAEADQSVLLAQLRRAIPGYDALIAKAGQNIQDQLAGKVSEDVSDAWMSSSAARAAASGAGAGSGFGKALTARDFGMNTMQVQQHGFQNALTFIQSQRAGATAHSTSIANMFITPAQRINLIAAENTNQFSRDLMAAQVAVQPDPMMAAIGGGLQNIGGALMGGGMGGMMGGGGGGGGGGGSETPIFQSNMVRAEMMGVPEFDPNKNNYGGSGGPAWGSGAGWSPGY